MGFGALVWSLLMACWIDSIAFLHYYIIAQIKRVLDDRHNRPRHGSAGERRETQDITGRAGSKMWGVLLVPSSSPTVWRHL